MSWRGNKKTYKTVEDIFENDESKLRKLMIKFERNMKEKKVSDYMCKIIDLPCIQYNENRNNSKAFIELIEKVYQENTTETFIIRPHKPCQTPAVKYFNEINEEKEVDSFTFMSYLPLTSDDTDFVFRRKVSKDSRAFALEKIKAVTGKAELTVKNLKLISDDVTVSDVDQNTSIWEYDFNHNFKIGNTATVQIENINRMTSLSQFEQHYLNASTLNTPLAALPLINSTGILGVTNPWTYNSFAGASTCYHVEDLNLASLNQNIGIFGTGKKAWSSCLLSDSTELWGKVKIYNNFRRRIDPCPASFRGKLDFVQLIQLFNWDLKFNIAIQEPGDIVIVSTGVPHQVSTPKSTYNEAVNFIDPLWFKEESNFHPMCSEKDNVYGYHGLDYSHIRMTNFRPNLLLPLWGDRLIALSKQKSKDIPACDYTTCDLCLELVGDKKSTPLQKKRRLTPQSSESHPKCPVCNKVLADKYSLKNHITKIHTEDFKIHFCQCGSSFNSVSGLKRHKKQVHNGVSNIN